MQEPSSSACRRVRERRSHGTTGRCPAAPLGASWVLLVRDLAAAPNSARRHPDEVVIAARRVGRGSAEVRAPGGADFMRYKPMVRLLGVTAAIALVAAPGAGAASGVAPGARALGRCGR